MSGFLGLGNVDWNTVEDIGFKPLPPGTYGAKITKAELSNNKAGNGKNLKIEYTLVGSKGVKGRKVFDYLCVKHPKEQVVTIALGKLKKLMKAIGKDPDSVQDTSELTNEMVAIKLKIETSEQYGPQNRVDGFEEFNEDLLNKNLTDNDEIAF